LKKFKKKVNGKKVQVQTIKPNALKEKYIIKLKKLKSKKHKQSKYKIKKIRKRQKVQM
jgi:cell division protein FtsX